jgi:hypothetical protein
VLHVELKRSGVSVERLILIVHVEPEQRGRWKHGGTFYTELAPAEVESLRL